MTTTTRVMLLDDEPEIAKEWISQVKEALGENSGYEILPMPTSEDVQHAVREVLDRRLAARKPKPRADKECFFDDLDALIVDYDLIHIDHDAGRYTGEGIGRLVRAFTNCPFVVVLNQFAEADFDLTQRGNPRSHADLNVNANLLTNQALWCEDHAQDGFCPWHWASIRSETERVKTCASKVRELGKSAPLLESMGFRPEEVKHLSDEAIGYFAPLAKTADDCLTVTAESLLDENSFSIEPKDAPGVMAHDFRWASVVASRLTKWLDRSVVGRRDFLLSTPLLAARFPFLVPEDFRPDLNRWNELASPKRPKWFAPELPDDVWIGGGEWLLRDCVVLPRLLALDGFEEKISNFDFASAPDFVFLEDASRFDLYENATPFKSQLNNQHDNRYIHLFNDIKYAPRRRLAL